MGSDLVKYENSSLVAFTNSPEDLVWNIGQDLNYLRRVRLHYVSYPNLTIPGRGEHVFVSNSAIVTIVKFIINPYYDDIKVAAISLGDTEVDADCKELVDTPDKPFTIRLTNVGNAPRTVTIGLLGYNEQECRR